jgi:hypothetical protein
VLDLHDMKFSNPISSELVVIDSASLAEVCGGMNWEQSCASYNVEDRRPGAGTKAQQRARTDGWNREVGCPTWADLHPKTR